MKGLQCPVCSGKIRVDHQLKVGQLIKCGNCVSQFEVVNLDPIELDSVFDEHSYDEQSYMEQSLPNKYPIKHQRTSNQPKCPVCDSRIKAHHKIRRGDRITCEGCYVEMTVVKVNPFILDFSNNGHYNMNWGKLVEDEFSV